MAIASCGIHHCVAWLYDLQFQARVMPVCGASLALCGASLALQLAVACLQQSNRHKLAARCQHFWLDRQHVDNTSSPVQYPLVAVIATAKAASHGSAWQQMAWRKRQVDCAGVCRTCFQASCAALIKRDPWLKRSAKVSGSSCIQRAWVGSSHTHQEQHGCDGLAAESQARRRHMMPLQNTYLLRCCCRCCDMVLPFRNLRSLPWVILGGGIDVKSVVLQPDLLCCGPVNVSQTGTYVHSLHHIVA